MTILRRWLIAGVLVGVGLPWLLFDQPISGQIDRTDPCQSSAFIKTHVALDVTVDAIVVALTSGQTTHVCGWAATLGGTTPTLRWLSGTGAACATSQDILSGTFLPTVGSFLAAGLGGQTVLRATLSEDLCADVGGTTPSLQGVLTYVKR